MIGRTGLLMATALSASLGLMATAAQAASIVDVANQNEQLGTFSEAIAASGVDLSGEGPFTVFAPSDQAFEQLPQGTLDELMKQENQSQLSKLVQHHVVQGEAIAAKDVLGKQTKLDTASGDSLTVDGTTQVVLLVPTGLTITQVGDQVMIEREGVAVATRAIQVEDQTARPAGAGQQGQEQAQQSAARTATAEESGMPMTEHQQEVLESQPEGELQQTAPQGTDMPATEHQREALAEDEAAQEQQSAAHTPTAEESGMPVTEHQQEVLESQPEEAQQQTAAEGGTDMPATEHQREALAEEELPGAQDQSEQARGQGTRDILREAAVVEPDIQADNGVIHVIDAVLVPQSVIEALEGSEGQG